jgi:hypothetical protein
MNTDSVLEKTAKAILGAFYLISIEEEKGKMDNEIDN